LAAWRSRELAGGGDPGPDPYGPLVVTGPQESQTTDVLCAGDLCLVSGTGGHSRLVTGSIAVGVLGTGSRFGLGRLWARLPFVGRHRTLL
jgi:hypothetical protein